jgi:hypothetical protein
LEIGIQAGYGFPSFLPDNSGPNEINYSAVHDNFIISIGARERSKKTFNLGMDLTYTNQSFKVDASTGGLGVSQTQKLAINYGNLSLDILPQFVFGKEIKIFVYPGFFFGTTIHSYCRGTTGSWTITGKTTSDTIKGSGSSYLSSMDFGLLFGIGLDWPISGGKFVFEADNKDYFYVFGGPSIGSAGTGYFHCTFNVGVFYKI